VSNLGLGGRALSQEALVFLSTLIIPLVNFEHDILGLFAALSRDFHHDAGFVV